MPCRLTGQGAARCNRGSHTPPRKKGSRSFPCEYGAGKESRTLDLNLGKVALYQLSYSRISPNPTLASEFRQVSNYTPLFRRSENFLNATLLAQGISSISASAFRHQQPFWRRGPESNRTNRICNPGHNRFATAPGIRIPSDKKGKQLLPFLWKLEREKSLELSTSTLARLRSTN